MRIELNETASWTFLGVAILGIFPICIWADRCERGSEARVQEACVYMTGNPDCRQPEAATVIQPKGPPP